MGLIFFDINPCPVANIKRGELCQ